VIAAVFLGLWHVLTLLLGLPAAVPAGHVRCPRCEGLRGCEYHGYYWHCETCAGQGYVEQGRGEA